MFKARENVDNSVETVKNCVKSTLFSARIFNRLLKSPKITVDCNHFEIIFVTNKNLLTIPSKTDIIECGKLAG